MAEKKKTNLNDIIKKQVNDLFARYIQGRVTSEITRLHHGNKKPAAAPKKDIKEDEGPTNVIGTSSSTSGTGAVDTFDPVLGTKKKLAKRKNPDVGHDLSKV